MHWALEPSSQVRAVPKQLFLQEPHQDRSCQAGELWQWHCETTPTTPGLLLLFLPKGSRLVFSSSFQKGEGTKLPHHTCRAAKAAGLATTCTGISNTTGKSPQQKLEQDYAARRVNATVRGVYPFTNTKCATSLIFIQELQVLKQFWAAKNKNQKPQPPQEFLNWTNLKMTPEQSCTIIIVQFLLPSSKSWILK